MRGEHNPVLTYSNPSSGSSPHARGALGARDVVTNRVEDHPRMRGEHLARHLLQHRVGGIIPACAGSTWKVSALPPATAGSSPHARGSPVAKQRHVLLCRDHPRMRGEHGRPGGS